MRRRFVNEPHLRSPWKTRLDPPQNSPAEASITLYFATASV